MAEGIQPAYTPQDYEDCERIVKSDPKMAEALRKRGVKDVKDVMVDLWASGRGFIEENDANENRIAKPILYLRDETDTIAYGYGRPIEGLTPVIDLYQQKIIAIEDLHSHLPISKTAQELKLSKKKKQENSQLLELKPLEITQSQGPSFKLEGNHLRWQNWDLHIGFNSREGLTLHALQFFDAEKEKFRPVMYRVSCAEMVVPYAEPTAPTYRRNAFDAGEEGLGFNANSLRLGCDCVGSIQYVNAVVNTSDGKARVIENAVCIHEEDDGVLWKHTDWRSGNALVARSRRLAISSFATVANYDYGFFWYLYQDGTVQCEVKLTGIMLPMVIEPGMKSEDLKHALWIREGLAAPYHQHIFGFRMEMCVENFNNSVVEINAEASTGNNPQGNAFVANKTLFTREWEAQRDLEPKTGRYWTVVNRKEKNAAGDAIGYKLMPGTNAWPFLHPLSPVARRAGFTRKHLWVTPYDSKERYPVGNYPNQPNFDGQGLPNWTKGNRKILDEPLVLWYTMNVLHIPRMEEWPIMPVVKAGFSMQAEGFFDENPTLYLQRDTLKSKL
eukprot:TRINITY_DN1540_c0_g1_i2.p1 TRINITY_DN1540_c0_g1~~TRINITY_DN1540_c0_g1_i2.p1  ORF type:complete len:557 (-),score=174.36 TRINITY_DN1540_c0_g1_i2:190-1860(-)